jgi:hypothetical protein
MILVDMARGAFSISFSQEQRWNAISIVNHSIHRCQMHRFREVKTLAEVHAKFLQQGSHHQTPNVLFPLEALDHFKGKLHHRN